MSTSSPQSEMAVREIENKPDNKAKLLIRWRQVGLGATLVLVGLLVGAVPMSPIARQ